MGCKFNGLKYCTKGIATAVDISIQIFLWNVIEQTKYKVELDYLQIFELKALQSEVQVITHKQEVPKYEMIYYLADLPNEKLISNKIYVIDDETHCTMMFADEY